jgi:hypothetical protein
LKQSNKTAVARFATTLGFSKTKYRQENLGVPQQKATHFGGYFSAVAQDSHGSASDERY